MNITCIVCPMGCRMNVENTDGEITITGNTCARGAKYAHQEVTNPMRTLTTLVALRGGDMPLCPVKTRAPIPKSKIGAALAEVKRAIATAPVNIGDVIIPNVARTGVDIVATANRTEA